MPAYWFRCPDGEEIEIATCLEYQGCRMTARCATLPYLRLVSFDRKWDGVTPSAAGNGPRLMYLKARHRYTVDPEKRVWAAFGTSTHEKLSIHHYTKDVLSEEALSDDKIKGIADCLSVDETDPRRYILIDYKNWGSYKVAKALGITSRKIDEPVLKDGEPILLKSGVNKGKPKTKKRTIVKVDPDTADMRSEELQLGRYRLLFESYGFAISKIYLQVMVRDGGLYTAKNRGIDKNLYIIPVKILPDNEVLGFYDLLSDETNEAFQTGKPRMCNSWESWDGRRCTEEYCEIIKHCKGGNI